MSEKDPIDPNKNKLSARTKRAIGGLTLAVVSLVGLQVAHNQGEHPKQPTVEVANPLTWVATPISEAIDHIEGSAHNNQVGQHHSEGDNVSPNTKPGQK